MNKIIDFLNILNKYSGAVTAIATAVLAIITVVYVILTSKICKETKRGRKDGFLPVLSIGFEDDGIVIKNTGHGLAQNLEIKSKSSFNISMSKNIGPYNIIKQSIQIPYSELKDNYLEIIYKDIFNRSCLTRVWLKGQKSYEFIPPKK